MNHVEGVISLGAGLGAIGIGFVGKTFYALGPGQRPTEHTKTVPRWFGRLWFVAWGSFLVYFSFTSALGRWTRADFQEAGWIAVFFGAVFLLNQILKRFQLGRGLFRDNTFQRLLPKD